MTFDIDYKALGFWLQFAQIAFTASAVLYFWLTNRQKANTAAIEHMRKDFNQELNDMDDRLIRVEKDVEHMPTHEDMSKLHQRVNETKEVVDNIHGQLTQIDHTMKMVNQHLIQSGK